MPSNADGIAGVSWPAGARCLRSVGLVQRSELRWLTIQHSGRLRAARGVRARCTMEATSPRWQAIADSEFPWERDALAFVRERLPDHDPYRAWSSFEFIADDGSINEVDLLVWTARRASGCSSLSMRRSPAR